MLPLVVGKQNDGSQSLLCGSSDGAHACGQRVDAQDQRRAQRQCTAYRKNDRGRQGGAPPPRRIDHHRSLSSSAKIALRVLARAYATLVSGCEFVSQHPIRNDVSCPWARRVQNRLVANHIRELDRFLCVLLEEAAVLLAEADHDASRFARLKRTSDKLDRVENMTGSPSQSTARLVAIRRISIRLRRPEESSSPAYAHDISLVCGASLPMSLALPSIAGFYRSLADRLALEILTNEGMPRFPRVSPPAKRRPQPQIEARSGSSPEI